MPPTWGVGLRTKTSSCDCILRPLINRCISFMIPLFENACSEKGIFLLSRKCKTVKGSKHMSPLEQKQFKTPFSADYWRLSFAELKNPRILIFAALMIALRIALRSLGIPITADLRINITFFVNALGAMVFGPVVATLSAAVSDTIGAILFPVGAYFFPFIFIEMAGSLLFALFLYRAELTPARVIASRFSISFLVNIVLTTPVMMLYYDVMLGKSYTVFNVPRIVKNLVLFPIEGVLLTLFLGVMAPICLRFGYGSFSVKRLKLTKKSLVGVAVLSVISIALAVLYISTLD